MKARFIYLMDHLKTSFWFLPLVLMVIAIGFFFGLIYLDGVVHFHSDQSFLKLITGGVESARIILSTIATGMLGVAGIVFSITLVALTLASSQFGPRILRNVMHDRINQVVLGAYLATYLYCLLVLRTVKSDQPVEFVPNLSVLFAIVVVIINIFLLIIYIHHISVSIQADHVISAITASLNKQIKKLFPVMDGNETGQKGNDAAQKKFQDVEEIKKSFLSEELLKARRSGYVQVVDYDQLMKIACEEDLLLVYMCKPGDFIVKSSSLIHIYGKKSIHTELLQKLLKSIILGNTRTPAQDHEFAVHQLVEIASRALSPGVNDPYTAITSIDNLTATMCYLTDASFPDEHHYSDDRQLRMVILAPRFYGLMDAAFNQIRQFAHGNPPVIIHLMDALNTIYEFTKEADHREAVEKHRLMVLNSGKTSFADQSDLKDLIKRYEKHSQS